MGMSRAEAGKLGQQSYRRRQEELRPQLEEVKRQIAEQYSQNPSRCTKCQSMLPYEKRNYKYCSRSCAATRNGTLYPKRARTDPKTPCRNCETLIHGICCDRQCWREYRKKLRQEKLANGMLVAPKIAMIELYGNVCQAIDCAWDMSKKHVNVEIDHIDGDYTNNKPENLRLLCPNCHTRTSNYGVKNKGNGRIYRQLGYYRRQLENGAPGGNRTQDVHPVPRGRPTTDRQEQN
jgi:hypothetical protein